MQHKAEFKYVKNGDYWTLGNLKLKNGWTKEDYKKGAEQIQKNEDENIAQEIMEKTK